MNIERKSQIDSDEMWLFGMVVVGVPFLLLLAFLVLVTT